MGSESEGLSLSLSLSLSFSFLMANFRCRRAQKRKRREKNLQEIEGKRGDHWLSLCWACKRKRKTKVWNSLSGDYFAMVAAIWYMGTSLMVMFGLNYD